MSGTGSEGILEVLHSPISQEVPMFRLLGAIRQKPILALSHYEAVCRAYPP